MRVLIICALLSLLSCGCGSPVSEAIEHCKSVCGIGGVMEMDRIGLLDRFRCKCKP